MNSDKFFLTQEKILNFITTYSSESGFAPSIREICASVNIKSTSTVSYHLNKLVERGLLTRRDGTSRSIRCEKSPKSVCVPLVGQVAAGLPILAEENVEEYVDLPKSMFFEDELFMLTVKGDSMINADIHDGDKIVVKHQNTVSNGEIAVVMVGENSATVKRYYVDGDHIRLKAENPLFDDIICTNAKVVGKVVGLIRRI